MTAIALEYPSDRVDQQRQDIPRIAFHIGLIVDQIVPGGRVVDVGGGLGLFTPGCAAIGLSAVVIDDFEDPDNRRIAEKILSNIHQKHGVEVIHRNVISNGVDFAADSFDAVTTFDSMEHWHHSPKRLFQELVKALKPNGVFVLGVPNCVNLRKRLTVPFGIGKWSRMEEWYESEIFRGHVREPDVDDLRYIANDLNLREAKVIGRNWLGYESRHPWIRALMPLADRCLQKFPALCSDIYLVARK